MSRTKRLWKLTAACGLFLCPLVASEAFRFSPNAKQAGMFGMAPSRGALTVKNETFHSVSLGREMHYRIFLPHNYAEVNRRFPVSGALRRRTRRDPR